LDETYEIKCDDIVNKLELGEHVKNIIENLLKTK
jgi:hypothetical protein